MSKCKSCGAEIIWIKTKYGKNMPCDAEPIHYRKMLHGREGMVTLVTPDGDVVVGQAWGDSELYGYMSHFATCPNADKHRRRK